MPRRYELPTNCEIKAIRRIDCKQRIAQSQRCYLYFYLPKRRKKDSILWFIRCRRKFPPFFNFQFLLNRFEYPNYKPKLRATHARSGDGGSFRVITPCLRYTFRMRRTYTPRIRTNHTSIVHTRARVISAIERRVSAVRSMRGAVFH